MKRMTIASATTSDYRRQAKRRLPQFLFDYIDGGSNEEQTMAANCSDFGRILVKQQVMRNVENVDTSTTVMGREAAMPVILAPVGMAGMMARRGEVLGARAAQQAGIPFTLSTLGVCSLEEVSASSSNPIWFQLYMLRDRSAVEALLERAWKSGSDTLVFTVDLAIAGIRHRDTRNGMVGENRLAMALGQAWQTIIRPRWAFDVGIKGRPHTIGSLAQLVPDPTDLNAYKKWIDDQFDPSVTWEDIAWLRKLWPGKLILKGIMEADDARAALDAGANGLVVSNHGGRQLDSVASSVNKLPSVVAAVGDQLEVYLDGGVRSGIDVIKAVALGARGVMMGRPWVWAVAGAGEAGLSCLLGTFQREISVAMALMGVTRVDQLNLDLLELPGLAESVMKAKGGNTL